MVRFVARTEHPSHFVALRYFFRRLKVIIGVPNDSSDFSAVPSREDEVQVVARAFHQSACEGWE